MIVKRNFSPFKVWKYIRRPMWFSIIWAILIWALHFIGATKGIYLNFTPIGILGSALAIFIAFRNNSAYARWWEARQIWGGIVNSSRVLSRLIITFTDSHSHQENFNRERAENFKAEMVLRCIAWVHALRFHLRSQENWDELKEFLPAAEFEVIIEKQNKPAYLQLILGKEIYKAMANGTLGGFDSFQMEGQMLALANYQGSAERIKNTPLPRQYDFFTRVFVGLFSFLLPFGLLGFFQVEALYPHSWLIIPLTIIISGVFIIMEKTGAANENPFDNQITDVPMTALCNTIERDLKEMLGLSPLPAQKQAINGYLF